MDPAVRRIAHQPQPVRECRYPQILILIFRDTADPGVADKRRQLILYRLAAFVDDIKPLVRADIEHRIVQAGAIGHIRGQPRQLGHILEVVRDHFHHALPR